MSRTQKNNKKQIEVKDMQLTKAKMLIIGCVLAAIFAVGAFFTVYYTVIKPANAFSTAHTTYKQVGELLLNPQSATATNPFNKTNMTTLINMIYGSSGDMSTQITSLTSTAASTPITAKDLRAKTYNKTNGQSIVVRLGGLDWIVTYVSTDTSGNLVATLWLSNNHQDAWSGKNENLGDYYGFSNGGLYSDWSADWYSSSYAAYPASIYGTSYIRTETLNNPYNREYTTGSTLTSAASQVKTLSGHPFALYTVSDFGLTNYITTPDQMEWMINRQDPKLVGNGFGINNESLTSNNPYNYAGEWGNGSNNFESSTGYANWGKDYLWLPSRTETGYSDTKDGYWETNTAERTTYDGSTTSFSSSTLGNSQENFADTAHVCSWTRSGCPAGRPVASYDIPFSLHLESSGSDCGTDVVGLSHAVRPALLLTLNSAASHAAKPPVTITLNKEGGSGGTTEVSVAEGDAMPTLTSPAKSGYTFGGYYTAANGGGTKIYNADGTPAISSSTFTANTTLYAKWTANTFNITINNNGGSGVSSTTYTVSTSSQTKTISQPTRTGYTFGGWTVSCSGGSPTISGTTLTIPANCTGAITLTANWTPIKYYVKYNPNGGSGTMANSEHTYDTDKNLTTNAFTRTGYSFAGWATSSSGAKAYSDGQSVKNLSSTQGNTYNLYAVWQAVTVTLTFNNQSATTAGTTSVTATYNSALSAITPPTRTGYDFGGYYTAANGGGTKIYNANGTPAISSSTFTANTTLYASWIAYKKITLATNISGAAGVLTGGGSYAQGSQVTLTAYANKGYNFCHWLKGDAEFDGNDTNVIIITADGGDVTYTAVFEEAGINVNVFLVSATKGGVAYVVGQNSEELTDDDEIIVATDICAVGYEFVGWYLDNDRSNCLSTDMSFKVKKSVAYKHALIAVYREISNNSVNQDTDN